jgi:hypothetical protein
MKLFKFILILILVINIVNVSAEDFIQIGDEQVEQQQVEEITREQAVEAIAQAKLDIQEIKYEEYSTSYVEDKLLSAEQTLERVDYAIKQKWDGFSYNEVLVHTKEISNVREQIYFITDALVALEVKLSEYDKQGVDVSEAELLFESARIAFEEERYIASEELIEQTNSELDDKKAEMTSVKALTESGKNFVERNWWQLIVAIFIISIISILGYKKYFIYDTKKKIQHMIIEQVTLTALMKKAQRERYELGIIPDSIYKIRMEKYKDKLSEIKRNLPVLRSMLKKKVKHHKLIKPKTKKK